MEKHTMFPDRNTYHQLDVSKSILKFNITVIKIPTEFILGIDKQSLDFIRKNNQE